MQLYHDLRRLCLSLLKGSPFESLARALSEKVFSPQNAQRDKETKQILKLISLNHFNCIDVGAYRGEILKHFLKFCPQGKSFAFEPIPENFIFLSKKYTFASIFNVALSDRKGKQCFYFSSGRPARSGLKRNTYPDPKERVEQLTVDVDMLDNIIDRDLRIDIIKIDVEGSELQVLSGAKHTIMRWRPSLIFEHGPFKPNNNLTESTLLYKMITSDFRLNIWRLSQYLSSPIPLSLDNFLVSVSEDNVSYYLASKSSYNKS